MQRAVAIVLGSLVLLSGAVGSASAQTVVTGAAGGAFFKFAVPPDWNGDLVIWNHGYSLASIAPFTVAPGDPLSGLGPLAGLQISEGYAVAASSYRQVGWAVFKSNNDLRSMLDAFASQFGAPSRILVTGASLGGIVTVKAIEEGGLGNVVGGLSLCGAIGGSRNWDAGLDLRLVYDAVCSAVPGAALPGGAEGLPEGSLLTPTDVALAVNACTGVLLPPAFRPPASQARLAKILSVMGLPENFLQTVMLFATFGLSDLTHDQTKLHGKIGTGTVGVDYGDAEINATIERVSPDPGAQNRLQKNYTPTGLVGGTRIVSLHTDKDGLVVVENESEYASVVPASNFTAAIAVEAVPSHCGFTPAEVVAAWESLRAWVAGFPQPTAWSIQATCQVVAPAVGGPCRIDPTFVVPDMDGRIRPR